MVELGPGTQEIITKAQRAGARVTISFTTIVIDGREDVITEAAVEVPGAPEREPSSLVDIVEQVEAPLRLAEWAQRLPGIGVAELDRAVRQGALPAAPKGSGPDHNVKVITPADMLKYVRTCEQVQAGNEAAPKWWHKVRKRSNGEIPAGA